VAASPLYLLDTGVVLLLLRGGSRGQAISDQFALTDQTYRPLVSVITHGELNAMGIRNNWGASRREAMRNALDALVTVRIDAGDIPKRYAEIQAAVQKAGSAVGENDVWIAATASCAQATLITLDGDFKRVPNTLLSLAHVP